MVKVNAAPATNGNGTQSTYKSTDYFPKRQTRLLFLSGGKFTAKEINSRIGFNDARKVISDLRKDGLPIRDVRMDNNCKLYWLEISSQPTLFDQMKGSI